MSQAGILPVIPVPPLLWPHEHPLNRGVTLPSGNSLQDGSKRQGPHGVYDFPLGTGIWGQEDFSKNIWKTAPVKDGLL